MASKFVDDLLAAMRAQYSSEERDGFVRRAFMPLEELADAEFGISAAQNEQFCEVLRRQYFANSPAGYLDTAEGQRELAAHGHGRYWMTLQCICPWVQRVSDLSEATIVELGCGTGSSTAALARFARQVHAFDIAGPSVGCAESRMEVLGIKNAILHEIQPATFFDSVVERSPDQVDIVLLFAVLEHMRIEERLDALRRGWDLLAPGGLLVIGETPNRLTYLDGHTSRMPFFHMLPDELAIHSYRGSSNPRFVAQMDGLQGQPEAMSIEWRIRSGTAVSYHEFVAALGADIGDRIVCSGYEPEVLAITPMVREEALLRAYFDAAVPDVHIAFARHNLNFILQKPAA